MKKLTVAILFGGRSGEHEVSLQSARSVMDQINRDKFEIVLVGITQEGQWLVGENIWEALLNKEFNHLTSAFMVAEPGNHTIYTRHETANGILVKPYKTIDVVFPVLHGSFGEDGTLQGLFEINGVAYVGAGVLGSSVGMDKALFKQVMRANQIPVVEDMLFTRKEIEADLERILDRIETMGNYPYFTKPVNMGSSVGINKCRHREELRLGILDAAKYDRRVMVEIGIQKPMEIEISVLGNENPKVSIPGEIVPGDEFYTYEDKYINGVSTLNIPAELPEGMAEKIQQMALKAYTAIDCAGLARVDFMLSQEDERLYLNEINTIPGFTQISMYPKLWEASGLSYADLIAELINLAMDRYEERARSIHIYQGPADE